MFTCRGCGHEEMVHHMFVGCCHVAGCGCLGIDGTGPFCTPILHSEEHNAFTLLPEPKTQLERLERGLGYIITPEDRAQIIAMKKEGHGSRYICGQLQLRRPLVRGVLVEEFGKGPATVARTRPRQEERQRALDAGITAEEFTAERVEGGRAWTIAALEEWIAERSAA